MRYVATAAVASAVTALLLAFTADGHWRPDTKHNRAHAVVAGFCGDSDLQTRALAASKR